MQGAGAAGFGLITGHQGGYRADAVSVLVDFVALDRQGEFVNDLQLEELVVEEDGREQTVSTLRLVGNEADESGRRPGQERGHAGNRREHRGAVAFVLERRTLRADRLRRFRGALERSTFAAELAVPHVFYDMDDHGRIHELAPISTDQSMIRRRLSQYGLLAAADGTVSDLAATKWKLFDGPENELARKEAQKAKLRSLGRVMATLARIPGHKVLVWVSEGLARSTPIMRTQPNGGEIPTGLVALQAEYLELQRSMQRAANGARVSIYAIDPTHPAERVSYATDASVAGAANPVLRRMRVQRELLQSWEETDSLVETARATGGRAFVGTVDLASALRIVNDRARRSYVAGYHPQRAPDGEYRRIEIKVRRQGLHVRGRSGYWADPPRGN